MTADATRTAVRDFGSYPTLDQRREALLELAEAVSNEQGRACQPISQVLPLIVPTLAAASVSNVLAGFDVLVEAVRERQRFNADPDQWLLAHDLTLDDRVWESMDDSTLAEVDEALDALMGKQSAVSR
jgi:hypothetical protein